MLLVLQLPLPFGHAIDAFVQLGKKPGDVAFLSGHDGPRALDHFGRHAQPSRDIEPGGFARRAYAQHVSWLQRLVVESHRCVHYTSGVRAVDFDREQVGGGQRERTLLTKAVQNGNAESAAFFGIGGAAQLVEQNE